MDWTGLLVDEDLGGWLASGRDDASWPRNSAARGAGAVARNYVMAAAALSSAPDEVRERWLPACSTGTGTAGFALSGDTVRVIRGDEVDICYRWDATEFTCFE